MGGQVEGFEFLTALSAIKVENDDSTDFSGDYGPGRRAEFSLPVLDLVESRHLGLESLPAKVRFLVGLARDDRPPALYGALNCLWKPAHGVPSLTGQCI